MNRPSLLPHLLIVTLVGAIPAARAWDYPGHRMVNELALASLPPDFPAFVREPAAAGRIAFLAGEPDRWRNSPDLPFKHVNEPDHEIDLEDLADVGLTPDTLSEFRQVFAAQVAVARAQHPERFEPIDPAKNTYHTRELIHFLPWAITESFGRLRSAFIYLRTFEELGTPEEIANAQANVIYLMGVMGHYVGDGSQPLHTTRNYNGWVEANPHGYTKWKGIHAWIDGGLIAKAGITTARLVGRVTPAQPIPLAPRPDGRDPMFDAVVDYIVAQNKLVEPLYQLEKAGKLGHGPEPVSVEGGAFIERQLLTGGEMLGAIWLTAWRAGGEDNYLRVQLLKRAQTSAPAPVAPGKP